MSMERHPLVLVPGLMCDHAVWEPLMPWLAPHAECTIADHGRADSLTTMAEQILARAPDRFDLAGHSMGGRVALEVCRLAPGRVRKLALMDTGYLPCPAGPTGDEEARKRYALLATAQQKGVRAMASVWVQGMVHPDRLSDTTLIEAIVQMFERKTADTFERQIRALLDRPDATEVLRHLQMPTLVLCGAQDSWSPVAQHEAMLNLIPPPLRHLSIIPEAGHMCTMERPQAVAAALVDWLHTE